MKIGPFEIDDAVRDLRNPHVISTLRPWVDAGSVGKLVLSQLTGAIGAREAGGLSRPGEFFDFTRYRPTVRYDGDERTFVVPNTTLSYARRKEEPDLLFFDVLEPHTRTEDYIESIMELLSTLGVKRYWRIGAWYGGVPHTRPLRVSHSVGGVQVDPKTGREIQRNRRYEGPTSMMGFINDELEALGIENMALMLQLPHYSQLEEDFSGVAAALEAIIEMYDLSSEVGESLLGDQARGERQYNRLNSALDADPSLKAMVRQLEEAYDAEEAAAPPQDDSPPLSPEIERFLGEITEGMDSGETGS